MEQNWQWKTHAVFPGTPLGPEACLVILSLEWFLCPEVVPQWEVKLMIDLALIETEAGPAQPGGDLGQGSVVVGGWPIVPLRGWDPVCGAEHRQC